MIDPLYASLAGGLLASALTGVVGNRADSLVTTSYKKFIELVKKGNNPENHDLQKAINRSYFQGLLKICGECLDKLKVNKNENSCAIEWLEEKIKNLKIQFEDAKKQEYCDSPIEQLKEIELLVTPEGTLARDRIKEVRLKIVRSALDESRIPDCFREKVKLRLFEEICDNFASELKDNPRVQVIFESQMLAKISAESEGIKITLEQIVASLQEISEKKYKFEKPIFTIEEYSRLSYIQPLLQYDTLIGRDDELRKLHRFLESDKKIMVMSGDGGIGKTKVSLEFAKQVKEKGEWNTYYINPDIIDVSDLPPEDKILLILDDASDTAKRDSLIASVSAHFPNEEKDLKLLLINRPIYNEAINSFITQRNIPSTFLIVEKGDIIGFLKKYYDWVDDKNAKKIEKNCLKSFDFAIFFAEYYREKGEIGKAYDVIKWKSERYIQDIAAMSSLSIVETRETIQLMSLLTPIYLDDIEHIRKLPILKNKDSFENILRVASNSDTGILFSEGDDKYVIKPDPLADFLRLELVNNDKFEKIWRHLFMYMAYRISQNIYVLPRYDGKNVEKSAKTLSKLWDELNSKCGKTDEYFSAIVFFTGNLSHTDIFDWNKINLKQWIRCYKDISERYPEKQFRDYLAMGLFNAILHYSLGVNSEMMEEYIHELRELYENHSEKQVIKELADGFFNATKHYAEVVPCSEMLEKYIDELRELYEKYEEKEVRENFAKSLVTAAVYYGKMVDFEKMEKCIDELRELHNKYPETEVRTLLAQGLFNMTISTKAVNTEKMERYIDELNELYKKYPENEVRIELSKGLFNAIEHDIKQPYENFILLYKLRFDLPDNENKAVELTFIEETRDEIQFKYNKNDKSITEFVKNLHLVLNNETELVILIDRVAENLPIKIQKSLYEALIELGL